MRRGMCLLVKEGNVFGVRVDEGHSMTVDFDLEFYITKGVEPPYETLLPCEGMSAITVRPKRKGPNKRKLNKGLDLG